VSVHVLVEKDVEHAHKCSISNAHSFYYTSSQLVATAYIECELLQLLQQHTACGTWVTCARCNGTHTGAVEAWQASGQCARLLAGMSSDDSGDEDVEEETEGTDDQEYESGGSVLASEAESEEAKTRRRQSTPRPYMNRALQVYGHCKRLACVIAKQRRSSPSKR
jgi:hypothetical protein